MYRRAAAADLSDAEQRLAKCTADDELKALCRVCLAAEPAQRPADGGAVAQQIAAYLASVQQRLEEARIEQAATLVRAKEQRRRLRLALGLAASVVLLIAGAAAAGTWYFRDQALREADVASRRSVLERSVQTDLDEAERLHKDLLARLNDQRQAAELLSDLDQWKKHTDAAQDAWNRADKLAAAERALLSPAAATRLTSVGKLLTADQHDREFAVELDRIRTVAQEQRNSLSASTSAPEFRRAFNNAGYDFGLPEFIRRPDAPARPSDVRGKEGPPRSGGIVLPWA